MPKKIKPSIIVLGNKGFIGNVIFRRLHARYKTNAHGISSQSLDLTRAYAVLRLSKYFSNNTVLVIVSGIRAERDQTLNALKKNTAMMVHIASSIKKQPIAQCIYLSTVSVYGTGPKKEAITEVRPLMLNSLYALAKYAGEELLNIVCAKNNIPLLILRLPRVYGPGDPYAQYGPCAFIREITEKSRVTLYGNGKEVREFLYVEDLAHIVDLGISRKLTGIVNVVSGASHSFNEAVEILRHHTKQPFKVISLARTGESYDEHYKNTRFHSLFPRYSFTSLRKGLEQSLE
jgi:nucleoside-diphosphate-sugar epimerase